MWLALFCLVGLGAAIAIKAGTPAPLAVEPAQDQSKSRRRRHIVADDFESRRRFESGCQICKPTPRIVSVGAARVTT
jgi:hypothetical protein